jgi:hypothetical protein
MRLAAACLAVLLATSGAVLAQTTTPAPGKSAPPTATAPATMAPPAATTTPAATKPATAAAPATGSADEAAAKAKCGSDTVVWGSSTSKVYHTSDSRYYGKTKHGSFMCLKDATAAGYHPPKTASHAKKHTTS